MLLLLDVRRRCVELLFVVLRAGCAVIVQVAGWMYEFLQNGRHDLCAYLKILPLDHLESFFLVPIGRLQT